MTGKELAAKARAAAGCKTLYINGCFGAPMTAANKKRYANNTAYNRRSERQAKIYAAALDCFGFDCCGLIKGLLWGWTGDPSKIYGGAVYKSNGVPDLSEAGLWAACSSKSSIWGDQMPAGAFLYMPGHCGIYLSNGLAAEATPKWADGVQITAVANFLETKPGYNSRAWTAWGLLPWIDYTAPDPLPANVKEFNLICNGKDKTARGIYEGGNWYIRLRDLQDRLAIATVDYNAMSGLPVITTK